MQKTVTVTPQSATKGVDAGVPNGTYTYSLTAYKSGWTSSAVTSNITMSC